MVEVNNGTTPSGYTQTGDPDGVLDNPTTAPIVLAPGDVYVNADFGYQPDAGTTGTVERHGVVRCGRRWDRTGGNAGRDGRTR